MTVLKSTILKFKNRPTTNFFTPASSVLYFLSKAEDVEAKKFVIGQFLDFKMVDSKIGISQVQDFQVIWCKIHAKGMLLSESFQAAALIEKLPNS